MSDLDTAVRDWGDVFKRWCKPFSESEEAMADNAANIIRGAIQKHAGLAALPKKKGAGG